MYDLELSNNVFESIKHIDEGGIEFWYARELQKALEYKEWRKFKVTKCLWRSYTSYVYKE